jgi:thiamine biosynthesis lipoprotein
MGTVVSFDVRTPASAAAVDAAVQAAVGWLHWVDDTFSTYKPASEVNRFDRGELAEPGCCPEMRQVLALCRDLNKMTNGYFDAWATARFDPSGVVKGWSLDQASAILVLAGLADHAIDGGGDVRLSGGPGRPGPWQVAVRHPLERNAYSAALSVGNGGVATSGTYERGAHVVNPFTGRPATELVSVTVVGPELTTADAFATAALAMGEAAPDWLAGLEGYEAQVVSPTGRGWSTSGFKRLVRAPGGQGALVSGGRRSTWPAGDGR